MAVRHIALSVGAATLAVAAFAATSQHAPRAAVACTGGMGGPLQSFVSAGNIAIVEAVVVGDAVNRAPLVTLTPTATATLPPTASASGTPVAAPTLPPPADGGWDEFKFDLTGYGATFQVERVLTGAPPPTIETWGDRRALEYSLRRIEAGEQPSLLCPFAAFLPRYVLGMRYLLFLDEDTFVSIPLDGDDLYIDEPFHGSANLLLMVDRETYQRYFPGVAVFGLESGIEPYIITQSRVPLDMMLRAIAGLRGDPSIAPPNTGTAGLKGVTL
jgi:hypothetical protein